MLDPHNTVKILKWYQAMGVDEAVSDVALSRYGWQPISLKSLSKAEKPILREPPRVFENSFPMQQESGRDADARSLAASAISLKDLAEKLRGFDGCSLKKTATNFVFADGDPAAPLVLIGEAPGAEEDRQGLPFVGASGQLLEKMLAAIGYKRSEVYITNIVPWRPPGNRQPTSREIALYLPFIERQMSFLSPKVILFLGGTAAKAMLEASDGIMKIRGKWRNYQNEFLDHSIKAMPTFHPAYLLRTPGQKRLAWKDFLLAKEELLKK